MFGVIGTVVSHYLYKLRLFCFGFVTEKEPKIIDAFVGVTASMNKVYLANLCFFQQIKKQIVEPLARNVAAVFREPFSERRKAEKYLLPNMFRRFHVSGDQVQRCEQVSRRFKIESRFFHRRFVQQI